MTSRPPTATSHVIGQLHVIIKIFCIKQTGSEFNQPDFVYITTLLVFRFSSRNISLRPQSVALMPSDLTIPHGAAEIRTETDFLKKKERFLDHARERNTSYKVIFRHKQAIPRSAAILKSAAAILKSAALRKKVRQSSKTSRDHLEKKAIEETDQRRSLRRSTPVLCTCSSLESSRVQSQTFESRQDSIRVKKGSAEIYIRYVKPDKIATQLVKNGRLARPPVGSSGERRYKWGAS